MRPPFDVAVFYLFKFCILPCPLRFTQQDKILFGGPYGKKNYCMQFLSSAYCFLQPVRQLNLKDYPRPLLSQLSLQVRAIRLGSKLLRPVLRYLRQTANHLMDLKVMVMELLASLLTPSLKTRQNYKQSLAMIIYSGASMKASLEPPWLPGMVS